jgi:hypothetical protein
MSLKVCRCEGNISYLTSKLCFYCELWVWMMIVLATFCLQCEPPRDAETYIHRSGRTGRAGKLSLYLITALQLYGLMMQCFSSLSCLFWFGWNWQLATVKVFLWSFICDCALMLLTALQLYMVSHSNAQISVVYWVLTVVMDCICRKHGDFSDALW